ncbi:hypothetical protein GCM10017674_33870 [Streptomyces gardneri]|uniref:Uncharacterized protein n=1 Tax=Streptomyces gardneri TaxID=66892 RepID=A0A4Y3RF07_9ACTN|nr:hypothetical protein SGA01_18500 [Streptomyces gardneri]GHG99333.1 hypothetical protein GCM10017674_33870 [Streptomyces gardneri]
MVRLRRAILHLLHMAAGREAGRTGGEAGTGRSYADHGARGSVAGDSGPRGPGRAREEPGGVT